MPCKRKLPLASTPATRIRRGFLLLVVLIAVAMLSFSAYSFCERMVAVSETAQLGGRQVQAQAFVDSGIAHVQALLALGADERAELGGVYDNPGLMCGVVVKRAAESDERGGFTVISPLFDERGEVFGVRHGIEDESSRLSLDILLQADRQCANGGREMLMTLPNMTVEIADAIMDWMDEDDDPRDFGAESEFYSGLEPPYSPRNGRFASVHELLLVRGVTPALLFGSDINRNFSADPFETELSEETASATGWEAHLTTHSYEGNPDAGGGDRIDINQDDMRNLYHEILTKFGKQWAMHIVALRQNGFTDKPSVLDSATTRDLDLTKPGKHTIDHVLELIERKVEVTLVGDTQSVVLASPFKEAQALEYDLPQLRRAFVFDRSPTIRGRVNILRAPRHVLLAIPGMTEPAVERILLKRSQLLAETDCPDLDELWLYEQGIVSLDEMRTLVRFVTHQGDVYRAQVVGCFHDGSGFQRCEIVIDATSQPRLLMFEDLGKLGRAFDRLTLGIGDGLRRPLN